MRGARRALHPRTHEALADARKAIVLLNRRGWSNFLTCRTCGQVWECPQCDVALVLHRAERPLACHHCGHRERVPTRCDACGSVSIARHGAGTERLESRAREALDEPVFRLDADVGRTPAARARAPSRPRRAACSSARRWSPRATTSPTSTLGVVLDADATLRFPDFRAEERTFALVTQLAGRAGRGARAGPGARADARARRAGDPLRRPPRRRRLPRRELERRAALRYPPFSTLIRVVCSRRGAAAPRGRGGAPRPPRGAWRDVLGPAPLFRLRGRERPRSWSRRATARPRSRAGRRGGRGGRATARTAPSRSSVDVDPQ